MNKAVRKVAVGDRVRVSDTCWDASIRGATGIITEPTETVRDHVRPDCFWVEFNEWIPAGRPAHPIEAGAVLEADLELIP